MYRYQFILPVILTHHVHNFCKSVGINFRFTWPEQRHRDRPCTIKLVNKVLQIAVSFKAA